MSETVDAQQVQHIANLARLELSPDEVVRYTHEMPRILEYFSQLAAVDTATVDPLAHPLPVFNVWAEDVARESIGTEAALRNAPLRDGGSFAVPKVLGDSGA